MVVGVQQREPLWALQNLVEPRRKRERLSLRTAADRAGVSEATWRQLAAGGVQNRGRWVKRSPRRDQVLAMAEAVGCLDEVAEVMGAVEDEVVAARNAVVVHDPAEEEIMVSRHLSPREKLLLIEALQALRVGE